MVGPHERRHLFQIFIDINILLFLSSTSLFAHFIQKLLQWLATLEVTFLYEYKHRNLCRLLINYYISRPQKKLTPCQRVQKIGTLWHPCNSNREPTRVPCHAT